MGASDVRIDVVFDADESSPYRAPTVDAVRHAATAAGIAAQITVVHTADIGPAWFADPPHGVLVGPGAPYASPSNADEVIRTAREKGLPLVAT